MQIQSLSIAVPAGCPNKCKFCVSGMHDNNYPNIIENPTHESFEYNEQQYINRMQFARDNGCNTLMLTGSGEPLSNLNFIKRISNYNQRLRTPFLWQEIQTSGVGFKGVKGEYNRIPFLQEIGINTISLSLSNMFDDVSNAEMNGTPDNLQVNIKESCNHIKAAGLNLRLSLNMTDVYNRFAISPQQIFEYAYNELHADQITFRELYQSENSNTPQDKWIEEHACSFETLYNIKAYIKEFGNPLEILPFGARKYSVGGMSVVVDEDCMSKGSENALKYLILRPNCKIYSRWDDTGSLYF